MLDQLQVTTLSPSSDLSSVLSTLLAHPDVAQGIQDAQEALQDGTFGTDDLGELHTEEDLITFLEEELSRKVHARERQFDQYLGQPSLSYWHHLGFALGWIDLALAEQQQKGARSSC